MLKENARKEDDAMKRIGLLCICLLFVWVAKAQCETENKAFRAGENVTYDLYFNWKFVWVKAGTAQMSITETTYDNEPAYRTFLQTKGNKRADFFFIMRDTLENVMSQKLVPYYFRKGAEEGSRYTVDEVTFSYKDGKCHIKQSRHRKDRKPKYSQQVEEHCVYDMLSILARARSFDPSDYKVGQKIRFPMATGAAVEEQTLIFRGQEVVEANDKQNYRCLKFSLVEYKEGKEREVITFYISDDANHLPIRLDMYLNFGSAKAFLTSVQGNRHPITARVDKK